MADIDGDLGGQVAFLQPHAGDRCKWRVWRCSCSGAACSLAPAAPGGGRLGYCGGRVGNPSPRGAAPAGGSITSVMRLRSGVAPSLGAEHLSSPVIKVMPSLLFSVLCASPAPVGWQLGYTRYSLSASGRVGTAWSGCPVARVEHLHVQMGGAPVVPAPYRSCGTSPRHRHPPAGCRAGIASGRAWQCAGPCRRAAFHNPST